VTPSILSRYVLRAWLGYLLGALLLFGGLLLIHETVTLTKGLLAERASFKWLPVFLLLAIPEVLALVLPMAALFGGLLGTQRLAQGSELVAAQGLGTGSRVFYRPWALLGAALVLVSGMNAHLLIPEVHRVQTILRNRLAEEAKQRFLRPGAPPIPLQGDHPQALWTSPGGQVHILEVNPKGIQHLVSDRVRWLWEPLDAEQSRLNLRLEAVSGSFLPRDGTGAAQLRQASQTISFPIKIRTRTINSTRFRDAATPALLLQDHPEARAELARRFSLPVLAAALLLVGAALGYGHPRFRQGSGLFSGLSVMVVYYVAYRILEGRLEASNSFAFPLLMLLPIFLLFAGIVFLTRRMHPHRSWEVPLLGGLGRRLGRAWILWKSTAFPDRAHVQGPGRRNVLGVWSRTLWLRSWGGVLATLLFLHLLIEYSSRAGDFAQAHRGILEFLVYWWWRVPNFLVTALPVSFMLGTVLALGRATLSNEWVALRTGGVSLGQWIWKARGAWGAVLAGTLLVHHVAVPAGEVRVRRILEGLRERSVEHDEARWQYLGATGVLWYMEGGVRWGFPLKPPGEAPSLLVWKPGQTHSQGLPWGGFGLQQGPEADRLFPDASLLGTPVPEENSTLSLLRWQRWAYDPARAAHLWSRLLGWLAGPCLVFAVLSRAFPNPRSGRGGALAGALIIGLVFLGLQLLFNGAASAGEVPAVWGILGPLLFTLGAGALQLRHLRT
jgi:lipopolysaccharide export system permease protein